MAEGPRFNRAFEPRYGEPVRLSPLVERLTVANPGPFTFHGTNSYLVGAGDLAVIDPGPGDHPEHFDALIAAIRGRPVRAVLVTHTHRDHSPLARRLGQHLGAPVLGEGPHRPARPLAAAEAGALDASGDMAFQPDRRLADGDTISGDGWSLRAVATPGHTANHLCFALAEEQALFSGDHVMAWSTTIVAPPDGAMADYMASLDKLIARDDARYFPGHGAPLEAVPDFLTALKAHRLGREAAILERLAAGDETIPTMVATIYAEVDPRLHPAAALSVLAHLEDLSARGLIACDGPPSLAGRYRLGTTR